MSALVYRLMPLLVLATGCDGRVFGYDPDGGPDYLRDGSVDAVADGTVDGDIQQDARVWCSEPTTYVYVVSHDDGFYRFDPPQKRFDLVSHLSCPSPGRPFSMAVARDETAYVLYYDPNGFECVGINRVDVVTGECLGLTGFDCFNDAGFDLFGMGYTTDGPDTVEETLYISSGWYGNPRLASVNTMDWTVTPIAPLASESLAEMTGNAEGELWGFFGREDPKTLARIDKTTGALSDTVTIPQLSGSAGIAVAHWGGDFYVFWSQSSSGTAYRVSNGDVTVHCGYNFEIVGAGVSTCAPDQPRAVVSPEL